ncbi:MAG TPA: MFS transporter [Caulobacteraceae bacterium]|nr:MFS transporter [Caulobacteraceae bacterium]
MEASAAAEIPGEAPGGAQASAELRKAPLGAGMKAIYGVGAIADAIYLAALGTFLFFYLTLVCGLANSLAGAVISVGLVVDAIADPLVGSLSDNARSRLGRRHPFMFAGLIPFTLGLGLIFSLPVGLSPGALALWALAVLILLRVSHSTWFLPYIGLGAELTDDFAERTDVVAARIFIAVPGTLACLFLARGVFMKGAAGQFDRAAYAPFGWACAALALTAGLACAIGTLPALPRLHAVGAPARKFGAQFVRDLAEMFANRTFIVVFASLLSMFAGFGLVATLVLHVYNFFWRLPAWGVTAILFATPLGGLLGAPLYLALFRQAEKRTVVIVGLLSYAVILAALPPLKIFGLLPSGLPLDLLLLGATFALAIIAACVAIAFQSAMADAADEHEHLFGTRRESLYYAGLNFSVKVAAAGGAAVAGVGLDLIGFPTALASKGGMAAHIPPAAITRLGLLFGPGGAAIIALSGIIFFAFGLTRSKHEDILASLSERRRGSV